MAFKKLKEEWQYLKDLPRWVQAWCKSRKFVYYGLFITGLALTFIPLYFEQVSISKVYEGILVPDLNRDIRFYYNFSDPTNVEASVPYSIANGGFHDISHISLIITLSINYTDKNTGDLTSQTILSKKEDLGYIHPGEYLNGTFHRDYQKFDWGAIGQFQLNFDPGEYVWYLMELTLAFRLAGLQEAWINMRNINIGSEVELSSEESLSLYHADMNLLLLLPMAFVCMPFLTRSQKEKLTKSKKEKIREYFAKHEGLKKKIIYIVSLTIVLIVWDLMSFYGDGSNMIEEVALGDYMSRYETAMIVSIVVLVITSVLILIPNITSKRFREYSIERSGNMFMISSLFLLTLYIWAGLNVISLENLNDTIIIDSTPMFYIPITLSYLNIIFRINDFILYHSYSNYFKIIIKKKILISSLNRDKNFNQELFRSIEEKEIGATITQIKKYFERSRIPKVINEKVRISKDYLNSLIRDLYLVKKEKENKPITYRLTPKAAKELRVRIKGEKTINHLIRCENCEHYIIKHNGRCPICQG
jgi:hypothetical protein